MYCAVYGPGVNGGRGWHGQTSPITTIDGADSDSRAVCVAVKGRN
jgi:hypothetical protein